MIEREKMFKYSFNPNEDRGRGCGRDFNNSNEREQWGLVDEGMET